MIIDCHNHIGADLLFYLHGDFPYAQQLIAMQQEGGALGVDALDRVPVRLLCRDGATGFRAGRDPFRHGRDWRRCPMPSRTAGCWRNASGFFPRRAEARCPS